MIEFKGYPKMARLSREVVVTEKIDGTNAQVHIERVPLMCPADEQIAELIEPLDGLSKLYMYAGSRSRGLTRETDNFGFAKWVQENAEQLWSLGEGTHFGEWWGSGIQRGYGLPKGEKRFSLFNVGRWIDPHQAMALVGPKHEIAPACCHVVPVLWRGPFDTVSIGQELRLLQAEGSKAAPGFMKPEGIVVWHTAANIGFKKTIEKDESPKGAQ